LAKLQGLLASGKRHVHNRPGKNVKNSLLGLEAIPKGADEAFFNLAWLC